MTLERSLRGLDSTNDETFGAIHSIALRGRVPRLESGSEQLLDAGLVRRVAGGFQLTALGYSRHRALLERERETLDLSRLELASGPMPALARALRRVRAGWRRSSAASARRRLVQELCELADDTTPVLRRTASLAPRFAAYLTRLDGAVAELRAGDHAYAFGTDVDSIGAVWTEFHEDLLQTLGRGHELGDA
jgi:hypothetical protein